MARDSIGSGPVHLDGRGNVMTQPVYGIAAIITDGTLRAFCSLCPWWSTDVGRSHGVLDYQKSSYARARGELTRHILTPRHVDRISKVDA